MKIDNTPMTFVDIGDVFSTSPRNDVHKYIFCVSQIDLFSSTVFYYMYFINKEDSDIKIKELCTKRDITNQYSSDYTELIDCRIYKITLDEN